MHVSTAPAAARKLTKATGYYRRELSQASRGEEADIVGAAERREFLTKDFQKKNETAERAIADTESVARSFNDAAAILEHPDTVKPRCRLTRLARAGALLGIDPEKLAPPLKHAATRAAEAAEKASARMDAAGPDLEATALHALFLSKLPACGWNPKAEKLAPIRSAYQHAVTEARKRSRIK